MQKHSREPLRSERLRLPLDLAVVLKFFGTSSCVRANEITTRKSFLPNCRFLKFCNRAILEFWNTRSAALMPVVHLARACRLVAASNGWLDVRLLGKW